MNLSRQFLIPIFSVIAAVATAQEVRGPDDFAGIRWNAHREEARNTLVSKCRATRKDDISKGESIFEGGTFANKPVMEWRLSFFNGQFYTGTAHLMPAGKPPFDELVALLTDKYGNATTDLKKTDGYTHFIWEFPIDPVTKEHTSILCAYRPSAKGKYKGCVSITYTNHLAGTRASTNDL
jgi:hypothetical protein